MATSCYEWEVKHAPGDKNQFSGYFASHNFTWRLVLVSAGKHYLFLEHFGYLAFDVFTEYVVHVQYTDKEIEKQEISFAFGSQLDFGIEIRPKTVEKVWIKIVSACRGYEAKKDTPYSGMINLGSTCYLNSIIQTLFHIKSFTKELFKQNLGKKTLEMQKLFYKLEKEQTYVDTTGFANTFKLNEPLDDQQDIQEFFKFLLDELEKEAKDTPFFKYIEDIFYGTLASEIECKNGCRRERTEKYNDIQLVIGMPNFKYGNTSLEDSLLANIHTTYLEEPNRYMCETCNAYVDATKKDFFKTFPPVLFFQIKRFNMDYDSGEVYKMNDYFSFPEHVDLSVYTLNTSTDEKYSLYSVNVHFGDGISEGHYYAYIKKGADWFKFNDCYVTRSTAREAIEGTFGGQHEYKNRVKTANAYYLVYVKDSERESLLNADMQEMPENVRSLVERDRFLSQVAKIEVYTEEVVKGYWGPGGFTQTSQYMKASPVEIKIEHAHTFNQLKTQAKRVLSSPKASVEQVLLYSIDKEGGLALIEDLDIVGNLPTHAIFAVENTEGIPIDDVFLLFVKTEKTINQPYNLKVIADVKMVQVVSKTQRISEWAGVNCKGMSSPLAELGARPEDIPETATFSDVFKGASGVLVLDGGKDSLVEYFEEVSTHKVVRVYINELPMFSLWKKKEWSGEDAFDALAEKLHSKEFSVVAVESTGLYVETKDKHVVVECVYLKDRTENVNLVEKKAVIVPQVVYGEYFLKLFDLTKENLKHKTRVVKTYAGSDVMSLSKVSEKISVKNGALITIQQINKRTYAEAAVKYTTETVGHPFFIDVTEDKSAMETKRNCGMENSTVVRFSSKKQTVIEDSSVIKKASSGDRFVFLINFLLKWKMQNTKTFSA
ncbi:ubiquitin carboxyl-terminal hydrolase 7 [Nematocida sp. AWRm77]|nr:ubiquitin carboxyl-terminal hydrolase 7 [Nematocida sp. AWRm77]